MSFVAPPRRVAGLILCSLAAGVLFLAGCRMAQSPPPPSSPSINTGAEAGPNVEAVRTTETEQAGMFQRLVPCESAEESPQAPRRLTANIEGEVTDATGAVMPGAEVTVTSDASGWFRRDYSAEVGKYNFPILRPGSYTIEARVEGFKVATRSGVQVDREPSVRIDFELEIGEVYTESDFPPLHWAASDSDLEEIEALLDAGADVEERDKLGSTPLHWAVGNENPAVTKALLDAGADPMAREEDGITPLHWAVGNENPAVTKALLDAGADPMAREEDGITPLHVAGGNENPAVTKALLDAGADPMAREEDGITPLHVAGGNRNPAVIEALLDAGADPMARDHAGDTPLHWAARDSANPAVIEALLDAGADPTARNAACETPRDLAQENEQLRGTDVSRRLNDKVARRPPLPNEEP